MSKPTYPMQTFARSRQGVKRSMMRGAVAVEMALLMIPLMLLAFGAAEYGRAIFQYNTIVKSVRDSARLLSQYSPTADAAVYATVQTQAKCLAVYGDTNCSGSPLAPGLTTGLVGINSTTATTSAGSTIPLVAVTITGYKFDFVFNPLNLMGNGDSSITFGPIHATMRQLA